jgi:putative transposase
LLRLVDTVPLSTRRYLKKLKLSRSTYYRWMHQQTLTDRSSAPKRVWNRLREEEETVVMAHAMLYTDLWPRERAFLITDEGSFSVSESSVYRLLKRHGLTRQYPKIIPAGKEYHRPSSTRSLWTRRRG